MLKHLVTHAIQAILLAALVKVTLRCFKAILNRPSNLRRQRSTFLRTLTAELAAEDGDCRPARIIGFLHPYCNAGGGGERVLWTAISIHQNRDQGPQEQTRTICAVYTGDLDASKAQVISKVQKNFGIELDPSRLILVPLSSRWLVEASTWPRFTLLGQSLASVIMGCEALTRLIPDIYIDTMGYAFTFPVVRLLSDVPVGAYVHYPTISASMIERVSQRSTAHNNLSHITNSLILSHLKLAYYKIFARVYSACLKQADHIMVNSSWTKSHIDRLLGSSSTCEAQDVEDDSAPELFIEKHASSAGSQLRNRRPARPSPTSAARDANHQEPANATRCQVVYPPCDVKGLLDFPLSPRLPQVLSISQFRPEKQQRKQIVAFSEFLKTALPSSGSSSATPARQTLKLILAGSCRGEKDEERVRELQSLCRTLNIQDSVEFKVNIDYHQLKDLLGNSLVGVSTMLDEHFGICIVEFMAAGLIPLVHRSGGPRMDIVRDSGPNRTGFHATDSKSFASQLNRIFHEIPQEELLQMRERARVDCLERFSVDRFKNAWLDGFARLQGTSSSSQVGDPSG